MVRIGHEETRRLLLRDDDPARPAPTETFQDRRSLDIGGERIELAWHGSNHTPDNIYIHLPDHETLMLVDIVNPGWAPVYLSNLTEDIPGYLQAPATALSYPWKHYIGGHLGRLGTRDDVKLHQQYMADIAASVRTSLPTVDPTPYFQTYGENVWAAVKGLRRNDGRRRSTGHRQVHRRPGSGRRVHPQHHLLVMQSIRLDLGYASYVHPDLGEVILMPSGTIRDPLADHLITPLNAALILIDYQPAQFATVRSIDQELLLKNIVSTVKTAKTFGLPIVHSTVNAASGQGKPTVPELAGLLEDSPPIDRTHQLLGGHRLLRRGAHHRASKDLLCHLDRGLHGVRGASTRCGRATRSIPWSTRSLARPSKRIAPDWSVSFRPEAGRSVGSRSPPSCSATGPRQTVQEVVQIVLTERLRRNDRFVVQQADMTTAIIGRWNSGSRAVG